MPLYHGNDFIIETFGMTACFFKDWWPVAIFKFQPVAHPQAGWAKSDLCSALFLYALSQYIIFDNCASAININHSGDTAHSALK
jgi:hypothetical protein